MDEFGDFQHGVKALDVKVNIVARNWYGYLSAQWLSAVPTSVLCFAAYVGAFAAWLALMYKRRENYMSVHSMIAIGFAMACGEVLLRIFALDHSNTHVRDHQWTSDGNFGTLALSRLESVHLIFGVAFVTVIRAVLAFVCTGAGIARKAPNMKQRAFISIHSVLYFIVLSIVSAQRINTMPHQHNYTVFHFWTLTLAVLELFYAYFCYGNIASVVSYLKRTNQDTKIHAYEKIAFTVLAMCCAVIIGAIVETRFLKQMWILKVSMWGIHYFVVDTYWRAIMFLVCASIAYQLRPHERCEELRYVDCDERPLMEHDMLAEEYEQHNTEFSAGGVMGTEASEDSAQGRVVASNAFSAVTNAMETIVSSVAPIMDRIKGGAKTTSEDHYGGYQNEV
jgi:hypothetical protein